MIATQVDPKEVGTRYLDHLNRSFRGWGDRRFYEWAFLRDAGAGPPDLLVLESEGSWLAGSALCYRRLREAGGGLLRIAVMTASWTRPEARRRGLFSRIIEESRRLAAQRDASLLLGFMTRDNASRRGLEAAGARELPSLYALSGAEPSARLEAVSLDAVAPDDRRLAQLYAARAAALTGAGHFEYGEEAWRGQFVERALPVQLLANGQGSLALVEQSADADRVLTFAAAEGSRAAGLALLEGLRRRAQRAGRALFLYGTSAEVADQAQRLGMAIRAGAVSALPTAPHGDAASPASWRFEGGDRI